jgi:hypothetical protein
MIMKKDIWYLNCTCLELIDVSFVKYFFSCKGENVQFVMKILVVLWYTISKFLLLVRTYTLIRHLARKNFLVKVYNLIICVILNYFTKVTKIRVYKSILHAINILCCVTLWIARNLITFMHIVSQLFTAALGCCILVGLEVSFVFFVLDYFVVYKSQNERS